ncbi:hypothetical protein ST47_g10478 [Ascochyta rabiei]|uniref:Uncharacterized protein n=1 Tax=Didymella rabiei TaxID=5454 RepID=A0A162VEH0_DIDRA|nr:hypothetical protein ST47_g10478 [Ascochyta rabiei]
MADIAFSKIDDSFTDSYKLQALFDADQLDQCIKDATALLDDPAMPRYHPKTYWRIERARYNKGQSEVVDKALCELRTILDDLQNALAEEWKVVHKADVPCDPEKKLEKADEDVMEQEVAIRGRWEPPKVELNSPDNKA